MDRFVFSAPALDWPALKDVAGWLLGAAWLWFVFFPYIRETCRWRGEDDSRR